MAGDEIGTSKGSGEWEGKDLFCLDLPSHPQPGAGTILVTGASGYIGGRLVPELLARGYHVRIMVRAACSRFEEQWPGVDVVVCDALDLEKLKLALRGIDSAYYLIHSLLLGPEEFAAADLKAAMNFSIAARENNLKRIIYLGGLGDFHTSLSSHLLSRLSVAKELRKSVIPVTVLRAAIIIGSGSASYEIIKNLVKKLPLILVPHWAWNECQPISVRDVIKYLVGVLEVSETTGKCYDICGDDILTYVSMMKTLAGITKKRRVFGLLPISNIGFYAYLASLLTPVPASITRCLMEGLKDKVVCKDYDIRKLLPFETLSYSTAIIKAIHREKEERVYTRWSDAYPPAHELESKLVDLRSPPRYTVSYSIPTMKKEAGLFDSICKIGGKRGWFNSNWMWRLRGGIDRILFGVGSVRGRKSLYHLEVDDVIDFWRIENIERDRNLLLRAEMKLPGKAWLEFTIDDLGDRRLLSVKAYYDTRTLAGRLYWYIFRPFHYFIFKDLIKQIERKS